MPSTAAGPAVLRRALRRFRRHQKGSAAVEFALVAPTFIALLFAILETSIVFFAGQVLETGVYDAARLVMTNQTGNMDQAAFKTEVCNRVSALMSCGNVYVDVKSYSSFSTISVTDPIDANGKFVDNTSYTKPNPGDIVVVRAYYQWPLFVTGLGYSIANIAGSGTTASSRLLTATAAFRVEPSG